MKAVVCPYCGFGCRLLVDEKTMKVRPYSREPNRGKLCPKGFHSTEFVRSGGRLRDPLKRVGSTMVPHGPDAVAFLASSKVRNEENYILQKIGASSGRTT